MAESSEIRKMEDALKKAETSFHVLFEKMNGDGSARVVCDCNYKDLLENGSLAAAREKGLVRMEGKDYVMKDGDVVLFRFNV